MYPVEIILIAIANAMIGATYSIVSRDAGAMSTRTVLNAPYRGLVEELSIPAELHERPEGGGRFASFGSAVPIHCCTPEEVVSRANSTHHYCALFTEQTLAPLGELAYVRLDDNVAEKVFINRTKRMLIVSGDGSLSQWRAAPTFESANQFVAGTPVVGADGALVSLVTAKRGNHYAVSTFEGEGGYFETPVPWKILESTETGPVYADRQFPTREALREHIAGLPPAALGPGEPPQPVLHVGAPSPRVVLVAHNGRQIAHQYLQGVIAAGVQYL